jgi:hypothetical protein
MDDNYNCKLIIGDSETGKPSHGDIQNRANYGLQLRIVRLIAHISEKLMIRIVMESGDGMTTVKMNR